METKFLLPTKFKKIGWIVLILSIVCWGFSGLDKSSFFSRKVFAIYGTGNDFKMQIFGMINTDIAFTICAVLFIIGGLMVAFSREKYEDEFIASLRLQSFQWSFLINYLILFILFISIYGAPFFTIMVMNMFTVLILFILRFHYLLYKYKNMEYEK